MGKFSERIKEYYNKPGQGVDTLPPDTGVKAYFFIAKTHFFKLMTINMMFLLFSTPVITIPAAITAHNKVLLNLIRKGYCHTFSDFFDSFKTDFLQSLFVGIAYAALAFLVYFLSVNLANMFEGFAAGYALALLFVFYAIIFVMASYSFAMIAIVNLPLGAVLKNSLIFLFVEFKRNFVLVGAALLQFGIIILFPHSAPVIALLLFSFTQLMVCVCINPAIQQRVIEPHYATIP